MLKVIKGFTSASCGIAISAATFLTLTVPTYGQMERSFRDIYILVVAAVAIYFCYSVMTKMNSKKVSDFILWLAGTIGYCAIAYEITIDLIYSIKAGIL